MTSADNDGKVRRDINDIPDELLIYIFQCLPSESLLSCEYVCERWNNLVKHSAVWRHIEVVYNGYSDQETNERLINIINLHSDYIQRIKIINITYQNYNVIKTIMKLCKNIVGLDIQVSVIGKEFGNEISNLSNLRKLNIYYTDIIYYSDILKISIRYDNFKYLNHVCLPGWGLNYNNCHTLLECCNLSHIFIEEVKYVDLGFVESLILSKKRILRALHLYGGRSVCDSILHLLSQCPQLDYLGIWDCRSLSDEGLLYLSSFKTIKHLQFQYNETFSESALKKIFDSSTLASLECLILNFILNITPAVEDLVPYYIENHRKLKFLYLNCSLHVDVQYENEFRSKYRREFHL